MLSEGSVRSVARIKAFARRDEWNRKHPAGTVVEYRHPGGYHSLIGPTLHRTRREAYVTNRNVVEVYLEGKGKPVPIETLKARA